MSYTEEESIQRLDEKRNTPHRTYLVTYSQLDHRKFPTRHSFGAAVVEAFGANCVDYFVVSKEHHKEGGYHYHCALRLNKAMRWKSSKNYLKENYGIIVNYSVSREMYVGRYTVKNDKHRAFIGSVLVKHPNLEMISGTYSRAILANTTYCQNRQHEDEAGTSEKKPKAERIKKGDVAMFIVENDIKTELQLMSFSIERRNLGDRALYDYSISLRRTLRQELVQDAWTFENSNKLMSNENVNRIKMLEEQVNKPCACNGTWLVCARDILVKNNIDKEKFCGALYAAIEKGRCKHVNILITGPADCGKTFILEPVCDVFPDVFQNPASSTFGWLGVKTSNLIFINDFRWSPRRKGGYIDWADLLKLLEGAQVTLPAPMNSNTAHIGVTKCMPIFATSLEEVHYWINHPDEPLTDRHRTENEMMKSRWNVFRFFYQIKKEDKVNVPKCATCFAKLVLDI